MSHVWNFMQNEGKNVNLLLKFHLDPKVEYASHCTGFHENPPDFNGSMWGFLHRFSLQSLETYADYRQ
jgi:hypothetical protein